MPKSETGWIRQLASGNWAATVHLHNNPTKKRATETFPLKEMATTWARETIRADARGEYIDPALGKVTIGELWAKYGHTRRLEQASRKRDESHWRAHVAPKWAASPVGPILKPDITAWVTEMERAGVGPTTIEGAVGVLRSILEIAVEARIIRVSPAVGVHTPERNAHLDRILDDDEDKAVLDNIDQLFPGRVDGRLFVEVLLYCGLRYGEAAALRREQVDMRAHMLHIGPVMLKDGTIKERPKSPAGIRPVPVDDDLWRPLRDHVMTVAPGGFLFRAAEGGPLLYDNWRDRLWDKVLLRRVPMTEAEVAAYVAKQKATGKRSGWRPDYYREEPIIATPLPTPHDLRHTYGTRLAEAGVPPHEIMSLMGHSNLKSVQRYLHARAGRFHRARAAMQAARLRAYNVE